MSNVGVGNTCLFMLAIVICFICILIFVCMAQLPLMYSSRENIHTRCVYIFTQRIPNCILCVKTYT